jgi:hypothetical protein
MRKTMLVILFALAGMMAFSACDSENALSTDGFRDSLAFGTGFGGNGFSLTGESDTFEVATTSMLTFRMESSANFDGRFVRLYFNDITNKDFAACASADAHICLSQFPVSTPGTYVVDAYLVQTIIDIGKETFVASHTFTLE